MSRTHSVVVSRRRGAWRTGSAAAVAASDDISACSALSARSTVASQVPISITFEGITFDEGFRADLIVLIELKSLERVAPVHKKVVLTYLRLSGLHLGLLINFGAPVPKDGYERLVNELDEQNRAERGESAERPSQGRTPE